LISAYLPASAQVVVTPAVSQTFLERLTDLPAARHLMHFGSVPALSLALGSALREHGTEPVDADQRLWIHALPPVLFSRRSPATSRPP
jgi:hypothetical protein